MADFRQGSEAGRGARDGTGQAERRRPSWRQSPSAGQVGEEPFVGALARIYIRRDASSEALARIKHHLVETARGHFACVAFFEWTAIDVACEEDLLSIRATFPSYVDGWKKLR